MSFFERNGKQIDRARIKDGDLLRFAEFEFVVEIEKKQTLTPSQASPDDFSKTEESVEQSADNTNTEQIEFATESMSADQMMEFGIENEQVDFVIDPSDTETAEVDGSDFSLGLFENDLDFVDVNTAASGSGLASGAVTPDSEHEMDYKADEPSQENDANETAQDALPASDPENDETNDADDSQSALGDDEQDSADDPGTVEPEAFVYDGHDSSFEVETYVDELGNSEHFAEKNDEEVGIVEDSRMEAPEDPPKVTEEPGEDDQLDLKVDSTDKLETADEEYRPVNEDSQKQLPAAEAESASQEIDSESRQVFSARISNNGSVWRYSIRASSVFDLLKVNKSLYRIKAGRNSCDTQEFKMDEHGYLDLMEPGIYAIDPSDAEKLGEFAMQFRSRIQHPSALSTFLSFAPKSTCEKFFASFRGILLTDQYDDPEILTLLEPEEFGKEMGADTELE